KFEAPVYPGDTIAVKVKVAKKNEPLRALSLSVEVTKESDAGKKAASGLAEVALSGPPAAGSVAAVGSAVLSVPAFRQSMPAGAVALVTGGSRGIGAAAAEALARRGLRVVVQYRADDAAAEKTMAGLRSFGASAAACKADLASSEGARQAFDAAVREYGRVDVLVNNAGPAVVRRDILELAPGELKSCFDVYVSSAFDLVRLAAPGMRERGFGRVINILSSVVLGAPPQGWTAYATAKHALWGLTRSLALELGPWGITCNAVSPSLVPTDQWSGLSENQLRAMALRNPTRRLAGVRDVAETVAFLAGPEAQHINGANIPVTGGETL
ncbi:MAG: SDR family oxidoreductase, partial [Elusimicrobiota bacterium]